MQRAVAAHKKSGRHIIIHEFARPDKSPILYMPALCCGYQYSTNHHRKPAEFKLISMEANTSKLRGLSRQIKNAIFTPPALQIGARSSQKKTPTLAFKCDSPKGIYGLQCALITRGVL
jgi:hypothetical protein